MPGRYAGSPIQLDFGELDESKEVVLVDLEPGEPARVRSIELEKGRRLRRFAGTLDQLEAWSKDVGEELCLLTVDVEEPVADLSDRVAAYLPNAVVLQAHERVANRKLAPIDEEGEVGAEPTLAEHFRTYLETQGTKGAAADRVLAAFGTLLQALELEEDPRFPDEALLLAELPEPPPRSRG